MVPLRKFLLVSTLVVLLLNKATASSFAVWQGFEHQWKYNHRLNRLGDYIAQSAETKHEKKYFSSVHTGATGLGKDSATFKSYFSTIKTNDAIYFPGVEQFTLKGKQGQYYEHTRVIYVPKSYLKNQNKYASILNGFDIVSNAGADKIQMLHIAIADAIPSNKKDTLILKIKIALVFNCTSFECNRFNKNFDYKITIRYLLLGASHHKMNVSTIPYHHTINWTKKEFLSPIAYQNSCVVNANFNSAFLAYQQISIILNTDHWFVSLANAITNVAYDKSKQKITYNTTSYFKQWEKDMQKASTQSKFSSAKSGWGIIFGNMVLIELKQAIINNYIQDGCIFWNGKNKKPNTNDCLNTNQIEIL